MRPAGQSFAANSDTAGRDQPPLRPPQSNEPAGPVVRFYRVIEQARAPARANRSAGGTLPTRASQFCDAVTSAAGFGWHVFAPMGVTLLWDGMSIFWTYADLDRWLPLDSVQFPHLSHRFDAAAPDHIKGCAPPFLTALPEPGLVQIWTGLFARTAPEWSLLLRAPANLPASGGFTLYEGIVETDRWFGPLFTNLRLTRTDIPIQLDPDTPLLQVQPLPRSVYAEAGGAPSTIDLASFTAAEWNDYDRDIVRPNADPGRQIGRYALAARRRRRACPYAATEPA